MDLFYVTVSPCRSRHSDDRCGCVTRADGRLFPAASWRPSATSSLEHCGGSRWSASACTGAGPSPGRRRSSGERRREAALGLSVSAVARRPPRALDCNHCCRRRHRGCTPAHPRPRTAGVAHRRCRLVRGGRGAAARPPHPWCAPAVVSRHARCGLLVGPVWQLLATDDRPRVAAVPASARGGWAVPAGAAGGCRRRGQ